MRRSSRMSIWRPLHCPVGPQDSTVVFLPSAHIAQRIVLEMVPLRMGMPVWFSESLSRLPPELKSIRPTVFLAPPRVWERMYATISSEVRKRPLVLRKIFHGALGLGLEGSRYRQEGRPSRNGWRVRSGPPINSYSRKSVNASAAAAHRGFGSRAFVVETTMPSASRKTTP